MPRTTTLSGPSMPNTTPQLVIDDISSEITQFEHMNTESGPAPTTAVPKTTMSVTSMPRTTTLSGPSMPNITPQLVTDDISSQTTQFEHMNTESGPASTTAVPKTTMSVTSMPRTTTLGGPSMPNTTPQLVIDDISSETTQFE